MAYVSISFQICYVPCLIVKSLSFLVDRDALVYIRILLSRKIKESLRRRKCKKITNLKIWSYEKLVARGLQKVNNIHRIVEFSTTVKRHKKQDAKDIEIAAVKKCF